MKEVLIFILIFIVIIVISPFIMLIVTLWLVKKMANVNHKESFEQELDELAEKIRNKEMKK